MTVIDFAARYNVDPLYQQGITGKGRTVGIVTLANFTRGDVFASHAVTPRYRRGGVGDWFKISLTVAPRASFVPVLPLSDERPGRARVKRVERHRRG